jgi:hypothetical protein
LRLLRLGWSIALLLGGGAWWWDCSSPATPQGARLRSGAVLTPPTATAQTSSAATATAPAQPRTVTAPTRTGSVLKLPAPARHGSGKIKERSRAMQSARRGPNVRRSTVEREPNRMTRKNTSTDTIWHAGKKRKSTNLLPLARSVEMYVGKFFYE